MISPPAGGEGQEASAGLSGPDDGLRPAAGAADPFLPQRQGRPPELLRSSPEVALRQARASVEAGRWSEAEPQLRVLLQLLPQRPEPAYLLGLVCAAGDRFCEAAEAFATAAVRQPGLLAAWLNLATALEREGRTEEAYGCLRRALTWHGRAPQLLAAAGRAAIRCEAYGEAEALLRQALSLGEDSGVAMAHLGIALMEQGQHRQALEALQVAVRQHPDDPHVLFHLGLACKDAQRLDEALGHLDRTACLNPAYPGLQGNRATVLFLLGRYREGWQAYGRRWHETPQILQPPPLPLLEAGQGPVGRLLLVAEQGLGDSIQFLRFAGSLSEWARSVRLAVQPPLLQLARASLQGVEVVPLPWRPEHLDGVEAWLPLLSVAERLGIAPGQPLPPVPYLRVDPQRVAWWRQRLGPRRGRRIALTWQGNPQAEKGHQRQRSLPLAAFDPLLRLPQVECLSLQRGPGAEQLDALGWRDRFHPLQEQLDDVWEFGEIAALLHCCDLLISPDTAITHLAGALGRPAVLLLKWTPDWRWGLHGEHCWWYPGHRLFRQLELETWPQTLQRLAEQLG